jgi:hypothetical protein
MNFKELPKQDGNSNFVKIEDKGSIVAVLRGEPVDFYIHWEGGKSSPCTMGNCEQCAKGNKRKFRFKINVAVFNGKEWEAKVFEQGSLVYEQLHELQKAGYQLDETALRISRSGTGTDTSYSIVPSPKKPSANDFAAIIKLPLDPLTPSQSPQANAAGF